MAIKTVRQWFSEALPEDVAERAIRQAMADVIDTESLMLSDALVDALIWEATEEGYDYWYCIVGRFASTI